MARQPRSPLVRRLRRRRRAHRKRPRIYRALVAVTGVVITLLGLAMLVLPGPALVVMPIGLALLALEFHWAERLLEGALARAERARRRAAATSPTQRLVSGIAAAIAAVAVVAAALLWDIPVLPF